MPRLGMIELNQLPAFTVLETISTEAILSARMAQLVALWAENDPPNAAAYDVASLEFDPIKVDQETSTYFELLLRDRVNQAARAVALATAVGSDIDNIASRYPGGMPRLPIVADPDPYATNPSDWESDTQYKTRIWLSPNTLTQNGVYENYVFFALTGATNAGMPLRDVQVLSTPGNPNINIVCMADGTPLTANVDSNGNFNGTFTAFPNPTPTQAQLDAVYSYITEIGMGRKGLTDVINVMPATSYQIEIEIDVWLYPGWDETLSMNALANALAALIENQRYLGYSYMEAAYEAALEVSGVYDIVIVSPRVARNNLTSPPTKEGDTVIPANGVVVPTSIILKYVGRGGIGALPPTV